MLKVCKMKNGEPEIFKSFQGEGLVMGMPSIFIRLYGCNGRCEWCDTAYSWNNPKLNSMNMTEEQIFDKVLEVGRNSLPKLVTITGGEPLLQNIESLVNMLNGSGFQVVVETNGSINPNLHMMTKFSISPKLSNSHSKLKYSDKSFYKFGSWYKFVITKEIEWDVNEVNQFLYFVFGRYSAILNDLKNNGRIILQPNGLDENPDKLLKDIVEYVVQHDFPYRILPQLHKLAGLK